MRTLWLFVGALVTTHPLAAQFGTSVMTPPPELPRRGAAIPDPKVHRRYSKERDVSGGFVTAGVNVGLSGDASSVSCGYGFYGKVPPPRLDTLFITISHAEPYGDEPDDTRPSLTIEADTLHVVVRQVVSTNARSLFEYDEQLHYRVGLDLFRAVFDADSADFRVRRHLYRMRGRSVEVCRWLGDRVADGTLRP
jgi:hypothetical protein